MRLQNHQLKLFCSHPILLSVFWGQWWKTTKSRSAQVFDAASKPLTEAFLQRPASLPECVCRQIFGCGRPWTPSISSWNIQSRCTVHTQSLYLYLCLCVFVFVFVFVFGHHQSGGETSSRSWQAVHHGLECLVSWQGRLCTHSRLYLYLYLCVYLYLYLHMYVLSGAECLVG